MSDEFKEMETPGDNQGRSIEEDQKAGLKERDFQLDPWESIDRSVFEMLKQQKINIDLGRELDSIPSYLDRVKNLGIVSDYEIFRSRKGSEYTDLLVSLTDACIENERFDVLKDIKLAIEVRFNEDRANQIFEDINLEIFPQIRSKIENLVNAGSFSNVNSFIENIKETRLFLDSSIKSLKVNTKDLVEIKAFDLVAIAIGFQKEKEDKTSLGADLEVFYKMIVKNPDIVSILDEVLILELDTEFKSQTFSLANEIIRQDVEDGNYSQATQLLQDLFNKGLVELNVFNSLKAYIDSHQK
ncbi:MAG: hypothetical protein Q9M91_02025 [Candidatus Dojkabacteria bacterium]|nr:hypothetical protein [Candidatus Dojkabacteria bacterium]MDQ7020602.1 hypothetical protein [Candidatus Dojkabacteria bacterium]